MMWSLKCAPLKKMKGGIPGKNAILFIPALMNPV
jgi:hypothetical protein